MDLLNSSLVLYLMIGAGVGVAVYLGDRADTGPSAAFAIVTAILFWPLYVPVLLYAARPIAATQEPAPMTTWPRPSPRWMANYKQHLAVCVAGRRACSPAKRTGSQNCVRLDGPGPTHSRDGPLVVDVRTRCPTANESANQALQQSEHARRRNLQRIQRLRERAYDDLMSTLTWVRELVSMIHLAKFTGAPASRAEEIVAQIAAAVEGLSEVNWQEEQILANEISHVRIAGQYWRGRGDCLSRGRNSENQPLVVNRLEPLSRMKSIFSEYGLVAS